MILPKIGIITVLYRSESVLEDFFLSLEKQKYKNFILYVIDNASPDNSLELSYKLASKCTFETVHIANDINYGIAKGNNIGIKEALANSCELILLSNNDVVFDENTIDFLYEGLREQKADMVVPKIYFWQTNKIWLAGGGFTRHNGWVTHYGYMKEDALIYNNSMSVDYSPTCFMLIRKELFDIVGFMDEKYFVYWDDTDFIYRAIHEKFKLWYIPQSIVEHKESTSTGKQSDFSIYYLNRNFIYFTCKNHTLFVAIYYIMFHFFMLIFKRIFTLSFHQWRLAINATISGVILYFSR